MFREYRATLYHGTVDEIEAVDVRKGRILCSFAGKKAACRMIMMS